MKTENILILAAVAVGGYFIYQKMKGSSTPNFVTTSEYQGTLYPSIPILPPNAPPQQQDATIQFLDKAAKANETVLFKEGGKVVGVQDAKLGMSYRIENLPAIMAKQAQTIVSSIRTPIVGTPYSTTSAAVAQATNNPLAVAAANLKKNTLRR
jgi:hypothetical protein